jgi:copper(I)-binding protein
VILHGRSSTGLRRAVIAGAAALVPVLAGCEAGNNAPTDQWHQPTPGASTVLPSGTTGQLAIQNVFALGAAGGRSLPAGSSAGLFLALVNTGPADRLVSASAPGTASSVRLPGNGVRVQRDQAVLLTGPAPRLILDQLTHRLTPGVDIRITLNFQNAGSVTLSVPVMPRVDYYATFSPAPAIPTATPKVSASPKASGSAKPKVSGSATATPSATPSASATP